MHCESDTYLDPLQNFDPLQGLQLVVPQAHPLHFIVHSSIRIGTLLDRAEKPKSQQAHLRRSKVHAALESEPCWTERRNQRAKKIGRMRIQVLDFGVLT
jgi:hypothetical protein